MTRNMTIGIVVGLLGFTFAARAADDVKIGFIDMQKAIQEVQSGKKAKKELETSL